MWYEQIFHRHGHGHSRAFSGRKYIAHNPDLIRSQSPFVSVIECDVLKMIDEMIAWRQNTSHSVHSIH